MCIVCSYHNFIRKPETISQFGEGSQPLHAGFFHTQSNGAARHDIRMRSLLVTGSCHIGPYHFSCLRAPGVRFYNCMRVLHHRGYLLGTPACFHGARAGRQRTTLEHRIGRFGKNCPARESYGDMGGVENVENVCGARCGLTFGCVGVCSESSLRYRFRRCGHHLQRR